MEVNLVGRCFCSQLLTMGLTQLGFCINTGQSSLASGSHRVLGLCPLSHRLFYLRGGVGNLWHSSVSSTTMPESLLALLMTKSSQSCWRVYFVQGSGLRGCNVLTSVLLFRHSSIAGELEAAGGIQVLFFLKGCDSVGGWFLKEISFLSKLSRDLDIGIFDGVRTSNCGGVRDIDKRLVMSIHQLWVSFFLCLRALFI